MHIEQEEPEEEEEEAVKEPAAEEEEVRPSTLHQTLSPRFLNRRPCTPHRLVYRGTSLMRKRTPPLGPA